MSFHSLYIVTDLLKALSSGARKKTLIGKHVKHTRGQQYRKSVLYVVRAMSGAGNGSVGTRSDSTRGVFYVVRAELLGN
jgi:hypothetical protein